MSTKKSKKLSAEVRSVTDEVCVSLSGHQDVRNAVAFQRQLHELVLPGRATALDCSAIESLDTACVQLLIAAKREASEALKIIAAPESEFNRWIRIAGAEKLLGISG
jgi:anti-anti-sigma factor